MLDISNITFYNRGKIMIRRVIRHPGQQEQYLPKWFFERDIVKDW